MRLLCFVGYKALLLQTQAAAAVFRCTQRQSQQRDRTELCALESRSQQHALALSKLTDEKQEKYCLYSGNATLYSGTLHNALHYVKRTQANGGAEEGEGALLDARRLSRHQRWLVSSHSTVALWHYHRCTLSL